MTYQDIVEHYIRAVNWGLKYGSFRRALELFTDDVVLTVGEMRRTGKEAVLDYLKGIVAQSVTALVETPHPERIRFRFKRNYPQSDWSEYDSVIIFLSQDRKKITEMQVREKAPATVYWGG